MRFKSFKDIHMVVKLNYIGRIIIYTAETPLVITVFLHQKSSMALWIFWFTLLLFWPSFSFLVAANSKNQKKTENRIILIESFLLGGFMPVIKFDIWACLAFSIINILLYTMIGGPKFFLKSIGVMGLSGIMVFFLIPHTSFMPDSSISTMCASVFLIVVSVALMGISSHLTNIRLSANRRDLKEKQDQIVSSLKYARTIQNSLMAYPESIKKNLPNSFIIWEPRDIVGGDIYYTHFSDDEFYIAVVDCTGHGVPGALLSMVASSVLQRIIRSEKLKKPSEILRRLNLIVKQTLYQDTTYSFADDGMDVAVCVVHKLSRQLTYAGAKIPLLIVKDGISSIIKGDKRSIGYRLSDPDFCYMDHDIAIEKGAAFYLFSDGITSQTGGKDNIMFGTKRLRNLLEEISGKSFDFQRHEIMKAFMTYQNDMKRKDDITLLGFSLDEPQ